MKTNEATNIERNVSYEDCLKEWMFRKEQLEAIKNSKLPIAYHELHYRLRQDAYDRACLRLMGF